MKENVTISVLTNAKTFLEVIYKNPSLMKERHTFYGVSTNLQC